ncbi:hypothetical protein KL934_001729 [Ogataea polymorpha]|nr:hypothetical protein KL934_001729 [Ogataea polymorpha]
MADIPRKRPPKQLSSESLKEDFEDSLINEFDLPVIDDAETDFGGGVELLYNRRSEGLRLEENFDGFPNAATETELDSVYQKMAQALEYRDKLLVKAVIRELEKEMAAKTKKMQEHKYKYELLKKVYKLPSVSNLAEFRAEKSTPKPKRSRRHSMVAARTHLDPITEEAEKRDDPILARTQSHDPGHEKNRKQSTSSNVLPIPIPSLSPTYNRSSDHRDLRILSTIELISIKSRILNHTFPDVGRITGLVLKFEQNADCRPGTRKSLIIRKLNNRTLLQEIEHELAARGEIAKTVLQ